MKVTKTESQGSKKVNVYLDNNMQYCLSSEIVAKYNIQEGTIISAISMQKYVIESAVLECLATAKKHIKKTPKSAHQLKLFLIKSGYKNAEISQTMQILKDNNLVNDANYINYYVNNNKDCGELVLKQDLYLQGIDWKLINDWFSRNYKVEPVSIQKLADDFLKGKENKVLNVLECREYLKNKGFTDDDIKKIDWRDFENWDFMD